MVLFLFLVQKAFEFNTPGKYVSLQSRARSRQGPSSKADRSGHRVRIQSGNGHYSAKLYFAVGFPNHGLRHIIGTQLQKGPYF